MQNVREYSLIQHDYAEFAYKCSDFYHSGDERGIAWNDPAVGIRWPEIIGTYSGSASGTVLLCVSVPVSVCAAVTVSVLTGFV